MTHTLLMEFMGTVIVDDESMPLAALHSIVIPALCMGQIPHGVEMASTGPGLSWVMLLREPNVLTTHGLLVDQGPMLDGPITTLVFNMTNHEVRVRKGDVVSRLIRIQGATWGV